MKKVAFIISHMGSGSDYLVDILNNNPRCAFFTSPTRYEHPDSLQWIFKYHKLNSYSGAIYGDHLLFNHSFCCKSLYNCCKFIYIIRPARQSLNEIFANVKKGYNKNSMVNYYRYRLRRICEMAKITKDSVLLTYDELISGKNFGIIEKYLNLIQPLQNVDVDGELDLSIKENHFSESIISQTQDCYEKYFYYLNNLGIKRP